MQLILYSKPGCHLCEGLQEKLEQIQDLNFELEVRDITAARIGSKLISMRYQYSAEVALVGKNCCLVLLPGLQCSSWSECYRSIYQ